MSDYHDNWKPGDELERLSEALAASKEREAGLRAELAEKDKRIAELEAAVRQAIVWFERPEPFEDGETYPLWQDAADYLRKHGLKEENWKVSDE